MKQGEGLAEGLRDLLARADAHAALVDPTTDDQVTYAELHEIVDRMGGQLASLGVRPGDAVALTAGNGPGIVAAFLAIVSAGAAAAPLNPAYTRAELESYLTDLSPTTMLLDQTAVEEATAACRALDIPVHRLTGGSARRLELEGVPSGPAPREHNPDAVALLLHTSGTTSAPKGVPIRQRNLAASARTIGAGYALGPDDVSYCVMPLFHVHGLVASTLSTLASGGTVVIPPRFSASGFWQEVDRHSATWFSAVPTIHRTLALRDDRDDGAQTTLRFARSCSSALPVSVWDRFEAKFGVALVEAYGMTEAAHQMASNPLPPAERRPGTVGRATGVEVAILDDDWNAVATDTPGEVAVRGRSVVDGYRNAPEANASSFRDGWFRTGDRGRLSDDGYLTLEGRIKELINRGGEKISPHEIEDALLTHPGVTEAVAFALPDEKYGERVGAAVVARPELGPDELAAHCADRLADFKIPSRIEILDEIPKGPTGKVQRRLIAGLLD
jgi:acyl-CoA synthetase (AMP-forming)/AMP-acid ligase II